MDATEELLKVALPYFEAEAEIAKRFFEGSPSKDQHEHWLRGQLWKELHPVDGYFAGISNELHVLADQVEKVDTDISRHDFHFLLQQMSEEFHHYVLMADLLETLLGKGVTPSDGVQLPEERRLEELRRSYATSGSALKKSAVLFTEGGGSRLFREGRKVSGGKFEEQLAHAMDIIYVDEKDHFLEAAKEADELVSTDEDLAEMKQAVKEVCAQRVAMRQDMFKGAIDDGELTKLMSSWQEEFSSAKDLDPFEPRKSV